MVKRKQKSSSRRSGATQSAHVRVRGVTHLTTTVTNNNIVSNIGTIAGDQSSALFTNSETIRLISDQFRLVKFNHLRLILQPAADEDETRLLPPVALAYIPFGTTAPTTLAGLEIPTMSEFAAAGRTTTAALGSYMFTHAQRSVLTLKHSDFAILETASPIGYISTMGDGAQTDFGSILVIVGVSTQAATTTTYLVQIWYDVEWRDLLDPSTVSANVLMTMAQNPNIEIAPGFLQKTVVQATKIPRLLSPSKPTPQPAPALDTGSVSVDTLVQALRALAD